MNSLRLLVIMGSLLSLSGCNDGSGDPNAQIGANPRLPDLQQYLLPPMHIAKVVGWKKDETPSVAKGLKIKAMATGLQHPRSLYVLPNGDVLVVESKAPPAAAIKRPKEIVMGYIEVLGDFGWQYRAEQSHHASARYQWRWRSRLCKRSFSII